LLSNSRYQDLGVSASKAGLHRALKAAGSEDAGGLFAGVADDLARDSDYYSFLHCDGAGTKGIVSYLCHRDTNDASSYAGLAQDALVMNLDDVFCIGRPENLLLANTIGRNSRLIDDEVISIIIASYRKLTEKLRLLGIPLAMTGGETADCGDVVRTLMVDAVLCGRIKKSEIIDARAIVPGDVIVGISSTGQASYEDEPHSGIGSNGLTLARHSLLAHSYREQYPEVVDPNSSADLTYVGPFRTTDTAPGMGMSIGQALASPTRTYAPVLNSLFDSREITIHGAIHCTGGGQTKVLRFGRGNRYIKDDLFPIPPLFSLIQKHGSVSWREMYQVFNMGHRMEIYAPPCSATAIIDTAARFSLEAKVIGRVEKQDSDVNTVVLETEHGVFDYML
jgi:phosphoribosylformylglycinamidine cyclo-ligase